MDAPWVKRATDMTTGERRRRMEKLLMSSNEDTPSRPIRAVGGGGDLPTWNEMGRLILAEQQQTTKEVRELKREVSCLRIEVAVLKTKAGFVGAIAGFVAAFAATWFTKGGK